jgi:hypothetical protein
MMLRHAVQQHGAYKEKAAKQRGHKARTTTRC